MSCHSLGVRQFSLTHSRAKDGYSSMKSMAWPIISSIAASGSAESSLTLSSRASRMSTPWRSSWAIRSDLLPKL